jgi:hypothetical protein
MPQTVKSFSASYTKIIVVNLAYSSFTLSLITLKTFFYKSLMLKELV